MLSIFANYMNAATGNGDWAAPAHWRLKSRRVTRRQQEQLDATRNLSLLRRMPRW
ncbi:MAG: hypothetical protein ABR504_11510 [Paracoccaceae bacterium]